MATKNLIPRGDGEGGIGKPTIAWGSGVFKTGAFESALTISGAPVLTGEGFLAQDSNGNVGIGTTEPDTSLHISSDAGINGLIKLESSDIESSIVFKDNGSTGIVNVGCRNDDLKLRTDAGNITFFTHSASTERMRIDSSGNVGIGTTNPTKPLHILSTVVDQIVLEANSTTIGPNMIFKNTDGNLARIRTDDSENLHFENGTVNTTRMTIDSDGNVGIGTTTPDYKLHVDGGGYFAGEAMPNTAPANGIYLGESAGGSDYHVSIISPKSKNAYIDFSTTERDAIGRILYSNPDASLTQGMHFFTDYIGINNEADLFIDPDGKVGIGTTSPDAKLAIDGDLKIGEARINSENDRIVFDSVPAALDSIGNPQTFLTAEKLGLGTSENLAITSQDIEFKLLTDENRFVVGTTGEGGLASGWYRFNDFNVKGATDVGAHALNPVDTRIYSDEDSFVYMTRDAYGNRVAHLVGGDEKVSPANNIALGLAIKIDSSDTPEDIEFTHTDGEQYSLVNGDSDSKGVNGLPIRQGFQAASIGAHAQPLLIDGGYF
jgi:hypothetical protein